MAKKTGRGEQIDEDLIRNLIGKVDAPPRLVQRQTPAESIPEISPPETPPPENRHSTTVSEKGKDSHAGKGSDYRRIFLQYRKYDASFRFRLDDELRRKLTLIIQLVGCKNITVPCLINNIIYHHLEEHREEINSLIENTTKTFKL